MRLRQGASGVAWQAAGRRVAAGLEASALPSPDQHAARPHHGPGCWASDEFILEVLQGLVVELELPLERAIGHAPPLAQQGDDLIHHRDKVHPVSSLPCALPVYIARLHHSIDDRASVAGSAGVGRRM